MKVFLLITGIILTGMSLLLLIVMPVAGILGIAFGVFLIVWSRKYKKPKKEEVKEEIKDVHTFMVAGYDHHQSELASLLKEPNDGYSLSGKAFAEEYDRVYEYATEWLDAQLTDEPENEFDENAIAVYAVSNDYLDNEAVKIGYIRRRDQDAVNKLRPCKAEVEIYGGKYKEAEYDDYGEFEKVISGETPYKADLYIESL